MFESINLLSITHLFFLSSTLTSFDDIKNVIGKNLFSVMWIFQIYIYLEFKIVKRKYLNKKEY